MKGGVLALALSNSLLWALYLLFTRHVVSSAQLDAWAYTLVQLLSAGLVLLWIGRRTSGNWRALLEPWTIGYGHTAGVRRGDVCTAEQAEAWLRQDIKYATACIERRVEVPLTQGQYDALASFVYNVGQTQFGNSTLLRLLNAGNTVGAAAQFDRWNRGATGVLPGLVERRTAERVMFEGGKGLAP
mgnify:CR=1 FL=1